MIQVNKFKVNEKSVLIHGLNPKKRMTKIKWCLIFSQGLIYRLDLYKFCVWALPVILTSFITRVMHMYTLNSHVVKMCTYFQNKIYILQHKM